MQSKSQSQSQSLSGPSVPVKRRVVALFCGFEPLNAAAQRDRFQRTASQTATAWNCTIETGPLEGPAGEPHLDIKASGPNWRTDTRLFLFEHSALIADMKAQPLPQQIVGGFAAFVTAITQGALLSYFRWAWRFALFFLFPFLLTAAAFCIAAALAMLPWLLGLSSLHFLWSLPAGFAFFRWLFIPWSERFHTFLLFANWRMALRMTMLNNDAANARLADFAAELRKALEESADEYLIASHSMGTNLAVHTFAMLLENEPDFLAGKRIVFATLGGALLQCSLMRSAKILRRRARLILGTPQVEWIEVQCLTDPVHFYKSPVATATGNSDLPAPKIIRLRVKRMLLRERYRRIRRNFLRVHRQYVMGADMRAPYDFGLIVAGPLPAASFTEYNDQQMPPLGDDGSLILQSATDGRSI